MEENKEGAMVKREKEVGQVLCNLALITEDCEKSLEEFEVCLSSVCTKKEEEDIEKNINSDYSVLLAQEINKIISRLKKLHSQMNYLRNRIEL